MKHVKLMELTLDNFKGAAHLVLPFNGRSGTIYGGNGAGKTTVYDGLTWLLFGKDSRGASDFDIKPHGLDGAVLDSRAITAVEAALDVDGERRRLRRTYYEKWSSRRGGGEVFDGHGSDFFVDGVPVKKYAFAEAVAEIVDEELFRVLTNVTWFCEGMHWRDRRAVLFRLGQVEDDRSMMAGREEFEPLLAAMGRLELDDFRKKLQADRKGLTGVRNDVPIRLDECRKRLEVLEGDDFDALDRERALLTARRDTVQADISRLGHGALLESKRNELAAARLDRLGLEQENEAYRRHQRDAVPDVGLLKTELDLAATAMDRQQARLTRTRQEAEQIQAELNGLREKWKAKNAAVFAGESCPTCRRPLEGELLAEAAERFQAHKRAALEELVAESQVKKAAEARCQKEEREIEGDMELDRARLEKVKAALASAKAAAAVEVTDKPDYAGRRAALEERIGHMEEEVRALERDSAAAGEKLRRSLAELDGQLRGVDARLAKRGALREVRQRMEALEAQAREATGRLEALDKLADLCEAFVRYKTGRIEEGINSRFTLVRWRLFEEQVNGGVAECCEATVGGSRYSRGLNDGARINAGIEVIDVLSRYYGVRVPLVVDGAESVTALRETESQVIRLVVSKSDPVLRVEMEEER